MKFKTVKVGSLRTNCYIIYDEPSQAAIVVDPGDEAHLILPLLKGLKVHYIVLTHGHPDHFGAVDDIKEATGAKVLFNSSDSWFLKPDQVINEGDEIKFGPICFKVLQTPGHSQGGICLYTPGFLFSGDTLFSDTCGRVDLPGGSMHEMIRSLKRLGQLPPETQVMPGHGEFTTIAQEKERGTLGKTS